MEELFYKRNFKTGNEEIDYMTAMEQIAQIYNLIPNTSYEKKMYTSLIRKYNEHFIDRTTSQFQSSINTSLECFDHNDDFKNKVIKLKNNSVNSFLLVPIETENHFFLGVARKIDEVYSITLVNKILDKSSKQFFELIFKPEDIENILKTILYGNLSTADLYQTLMDKSEDYCVLNIKAGKQKAFNCFVKEPEFAFKYAMATRNLGIEDLKSLREQDRLLNPKWDNGSLKMKNDYAEFLKVSSPQLREFIDNMLNIYLKNKQFRAILNNTGCFDEGIKRVFNNNVGELLKVVTNQTYECCKDVLVKYLKQNHKSEEAKLIDILNKNSLLNIKNSQRRDLKEKLGVLYYQNAFEEAVKFQNKGMENFSIRKYEKAKVCFYNAILLRPQFAEAYDMVGKIYQIRGQLNKAQDYLDKATLIKPKDSYLRLSKEENQRKRKEKDKEKVEWSFFGMKLFERNR